MVIVSEQLDPELRKIIKKKKIAIIPVGSIEQHGPHLPISTDSDIVYEVARQVSEKCNFLLIPTISYGVSFEHSPFFNLSIKQKTLEQLLIDICISLSKNGIGSIFIINGHYGNQKTLENVNRIIRKKLKNKLRINVFSYWHFMKHEFDHAGFVETSLMLAISKKVKMTKAQIGLVTKKLSKKEKQRISKLASKSFPAATRNGVWGNPSKSTAKQGKIFLDEIVRNLSKKSQTCLTDESPKLHH
ncbi:MAG TPA: creatininase family protein [Nitrosopumilaceae archaeon]|nr:creatininase family protein [Nitrosopumilaceae archaeon]